MTLETIEFVGEGWGKTFSGIATLKHATVLARFRGILPSEHPTCAVTFHGPAPAPHTMEMQYQGHSWQ